jgi:hypothetical protein
MPQQAAPKSQLDKSKLAARKAEAGESEEVFKRRLAKFAKAPAPMPEKK